MSSRLKVTSSPSIRRRRSPNRQYSTSKVENVEEICRSIVYGNSAEYFGFTRSDGHTHEWSLYVRPYKNAHDMSQYLKKVMWMFASRTIFSKL